LGKVTSDFFFVWSRESFQVYSGGGFPTDYFLELGMSLRREGRTAKGGFHHLVAHIFIDHIDTSQMGFCWPDLSFW
jgi:hypothetical protein